MRARVYARARWVLPENTPAGCDAYAARRVTERGHDGGQHVGVDGGFPRGVQLAAESGQRHQHVLTKRLGQLTGGMGERVSE